MYTELSPLNKIQITILIFLVAAFSSYAESISVHGVNFNIDEKVAVEGGLAQITIDGQSKLIPESGIPSFIAQQYFNRESLLKQLTHDDIFLFISKAVADKDLESAKIALIGLTLKSDSQEVLSEALEAISEDPNVAPIFKQVMIEIRSINLTPRLASILIYTIGKSDLEWIRANYSKLLYAHTTEIRFYLRERFFNFVREENLIKAAEVLKVFGDIFSIDDEEHKKLTILFTKLDSFKTQNSGEGISLKDLAGIDPVMLKYVLPIFLDSVHTSAEAYLKEGKFEDALTTLLIIDFERRTPKTHELILESIKNIPQSSDVLLKNPTVHNTLKQLSVKDGSIKEYYAALLEKLALYSFAIGSVKNGIEYIGMLSSIRIDPSAFNDAVRIDGALKLYSKGLGEDAGEILANVRTSIPIYKRVIILWYKIKFIQILVLALFIGFGMIFIGLLRSRKSAKFLNSSNDHSEVRKHQTKSFVTMGTRDNGLSKEYIECLNELKLNPSATLAQIKTAYRKKIKSIHPDHNLASQDVSFTDDFVRLKDVYERTLLLRSKLGLEDEGIEDE